MSIILSTRLTRERRLKWGGSHVLKKSALATRAIALAMAFTGFTMVSAAQAELIKLHGASQFDERHAFTRLMRKFEQLTKLHGLHVGCYASSNDEAVDCAPSLRLGRTTRIWLFEFRRRLPGSALRRPVRQSCADWNRSRNRALYSRPEGGIDWRSPQPRPTSAACRGLR